ncbi:hypothetical protein K4F52_009980 [Lecanicillium sp. MT-2017a]|nr:hypothetical protein K4F52_009980 [Lecanicillium sp. MT-2017a]
MTEVSNTRLYLGNLPRNATKADIEAHFATHGTGEITEVKLMNGFGFIEYKDPMDARDVVPAFHGSDFMGERLTVQFARGTRPRDPPGGGGGGYGHRQERAPPRPRRTIHRMQITGLPNETSWQDLKDFARQSGLDVVYSETTRDSGRGEFKGKVVQCVADTQTEVPTRDRGRSRSPGRRGYAPPFDDYDRRGPPGPRYSPRRDGPPYGGYRDRSPRRDYYDDRGPRYHSPPRRPMDDYPPGPPPGPRGRFDPYRDYPPPPPGPYGGNGRGGYDRPPPPPRDLPPRDFPPRDAPQYPREGGYGRDYDRGGDRYW